MEMPCLPQGSRPFAWYNVRTHKTEHPSRAAITRLDAEARPYFASRRTNLFQDLIAKPVRIPHTALRTTGAESRCAEYAGHKPQKTWAPTCTVGVPGEHLLIRDRSNSLAGWRSGVGSMLLLV